MRLKSGPFCCFARTGWGTFLPSSQETQRGLGLQSSCCGRGAGSQVESGQTEGCTLGWISLSLAPSFLDPLQRGGSLSKSLSLLWKGGLCWFFTRPKKSFVTPSVFFFFFFLKGQNLGSSFSLIFNTKRVKGGYVTATDRNVGLYNSQLLPVNLHCIFFCILAGARGIKKVFPDRRSGLKAAGAAKW